jgi:hypothetical protein
VLRRPDDLPHPDVVVAQRRSDASRHDPAGNGGWNIWKARRRHDDAGKASRRKAMVSVILNRLAGVPADVGQRAVRHGMGGDEERFPDDGTRVRRGRDDDREGEQPR